MKKLIENTQTTIQDGDLLNDFNQIILRHAQYYGKGKKALKSFFEDLQRGGCISGLIGEFIYHYDCKQFYIKHIDALEEYKEELEDQLGEPIANRHSAPHYTFMCWLCFEEYCFELYRNIFEND